MERSNEPGSGLPGNDLNDDDFGAYDAGVYRGHYEAEPVPAEGVTYEAVRPAYAAGHAAALNPTYQGRTFDQVEVEVGRTYQGDQTRWDSVREYARHAFEWRTVVGAVALAAGGWWAGKQLLSSFSKMSREDDTHYRTHFDTYPTRPVGMTYTRARSGYALGHLAAQNPSYAGRSFDEVEPDLRGGFTGGNAGQYDTLRDFCRYGYERGTQVYGTSAGIGTAGSGNAGSSLGGSTAGGSSAGGSSLGGSNLGGAGL